MLSIDSEFQGATSGQLGPDTNLSFVPSLFLRAGGKFVPFKFEGDCVSTRACWRS